MSDAKQQRRTSPGSGLLCLNRKMLSPLLAILRQQGPVKQLNAGARIDRTIAAMNEFLQLRAKTVAIDSDLGPAGAERVGGCFQFWLSAHGQSWSVGACGARSVRG